MLNISSKIKKFIDKTICFFFKHYKIYDDLNGEVFCGRCDKTLQILQAKPINFDKVKNNRRVYI